MTEPEEPAFAMSPKLVIEDRFLKRQLTGTEVEGQKILVGIKKQNWKGKYYKTVALHSLIIVYGVLVLVMQFFK